MIDFQALFHASPNPYMVLDRELRFVAANPAYLRATAASLDALLGRRLFDVFPHDRDNPGNDAARQLEASLRRVLDTGAPDMLAFLRYRIARDGVDEERTWSATHTPLFGDDGRVAYVPQHTVDITELARERDRPGVEAAVVARAEHVERRAAVLGEMLSDLRRLFEQAPGFLAVVRGPDYVFEAANAAYLELVGRDESLIGKPVREALPEVVEQGFVDLLDHVRSSGEPFVGRAARIALQRRRDAPADPRYVDFVYQPVVDDDGHVDAIFVQGHDVTEQETARQQNEAARAELEAIFRSFPEALYVGDGTGIKRVNRAALRLLGVSDEQDLQRPLSELVAELNARRLDGVPLAVDDAPFSRALQGHATAIEMLIDPVGGGPARILRSSGAPVVVGGVIQGAVVTHVDITARRRAEAETSRLARVLDEARDFVGIATTDGVPVFVNGAGLRLVGLADMDAARERRLVDFFVERERDLVAREVVTTALERGHWEGELHFQSFATGEEIPVLYSVFSLRDSLGDVNALATITRDLRGQRAAERERQELLENERAARAQAEEANRAKDEFLAMVSHELRTPLTAILGWMHMLRTDALTPEKRARALETVERNARAQAQLVEDLLDVSRILSGKLGLEMEATDMATVVTTALETVRPMANAKSLTLHARVEPCSVTGDARRLQQVVWNLLANAVKFTPAGGEVRVRGARDGDAFVLDVEDTGVGIAADFLPHVFERFRQADSGSTRRAGGLGLGLSIVRFLVEAHHGTVTVRSEGDGRGSCFTVRLPALDALDPAIPTERALPLDPPALTGVRVLVVDDEPDTREYVRALLERCQAVVSEARDAAEALAALQRERPHLLLSDIHMPEVDGYRLIRDVRSLPEDRGGATPAVALTAYARPADRARAMLAGFQNHVTKPIEPAELLAAVAALAPRAL